MQLEALKVFCDIANFRSFSKAAEANGLTQPAVSRVVRLLEKRLKARLIDRSRRPLQLTAPGQAYYEGCKTLLEQYLELEASILRAHAQLALTVRVAAIYSVGLGDMGQYVERFEAQCAHAKAQIDYVHPNQVYARVLEGTADFGLVSFPRESRELAVLPWREEEMVVACAPTHPLARQTPEGGAVPPDRLDGEKFVAFDKGLVIRREVDRFLREHGAQVEVALELDNIESMKKGIQVGAGLSILPEPMLRQEVQTGAIRAIRLLLEGGARLVRPLGIIHRRQPRLGSAAQALIELLRTNGAGPSANGAATLSNGAGQSCPAQDNGRTRARRKRKVP
jgi:DNA-binding transcriptional LysR family regulator